MPLVQIKLNANFHCISGFTLPNLLKGCLQRTARKHSSVWDTVTADVKSSLTYTE